MRPHTSCQGLCFPAAQVTTQPSPDLSVTFNFPEVGSDLWGMSISLLCLSLCVAAWVSPQTISRCVCMCIHSAMSVATNMRSIQEVKCSNGFVKWLPRGALGSCAANDFSVNCHVTFTQTLSLAYYIMDRFSFTQEILAILDVIS